MKALRQEAKASNSAKMGRMMKGYAEGGFVPPKVGSNDRLPVANVAGTKAAGKIGGVKAKQRLDRPAFAHGGRAKKGGGKTDVTVIVAPGGGAQSGANPAVPPMPPPAAAPMPPPKPPMPPPPPPGAAPPGGMPPTGMPLHAAGGRVHGYKRGGRAKRDAGGKVIRFPSERSSPPMPAVEEVGKTIDNLTGRNTVVPIKKASGGGVKRAEGGEVKPLPILPSPTSSDKEMIGKVRKEMRLGTGDSVANPPGPSKYASGGGIKSIGMKVGTKVSHTPGKNDLDHLSTKPPLLTRKDGGRAYPNQPDAGSATGEARLDKIGMQKKFKGAPGP